MAEIPNWLGWALLATNGITFALWVAERHFVTQARELAIVIAHRGIRHVHARGVSKRRAVDMIAPELAKLLE